MRYFTFTSYDLANSFRNRATKTMWVVKNQDGKYWVVTGREYSKLYKEGYEAIS